MARRSIRCVSVSATLLSRGEDGMSPAMDRHIESCAGCRSELEDQRWLAAELRDLDADAFAAPAGMVPRVMAETGPWVVPDPASRTPSTAKIAAAAAVATAATAAAAAGTAIVFRVYRHRAV